MVTAAVEAGTEDDPTAADQRAYPYQPALDGLRALAVAAVIAYHNGYFWASGGFLGVDAFFVLSGFLITTLLVREYHRVDGVRVVAFWGRRLRRLLPALLLVLVFCAVYGALFLDPFELNSFRWDGLASLAYVTNWRLILTHQSYFDLFATPSPFRHLWSLAIEEQFYLVWPIVVLATLRLRRGRVDVLAGVCVVGIAASAVAMAALYDPVAPSRAYFGTDARVHSLLVGAVLALVLLRWRPQSANVRRLLGILGAAALGFSIWSWHVTSAVASGYYGTGSLLYALSVAVLIAALVQPTTVVARALGCRPLRAVGMISYGLYLWHWPMIVLLPHWRVGFGGSALVVLRVSLTFVAAILSYRYVEQPIRHGRLRRTSVRLERVAAVIGVALVASIQLAASASAEPPPPYLAGPTEPCPAPSAATVRDAIRLARHSPRAPRHAPRIAVIGDSIACSLWPGLDALARHGWRTNLQSVIGCGAVSGRVLPSDDVPRTPSGTAECGRMAETARSAALAGRVPVAVVVSTWERADLDIDGTRLPAGSRRWRQVLAQRLDDLAVEMRRHGTHLVLVAMPSTAPGRLLSATTQPSHGDAVSYARLNEVLRDAAARHPHDVSVLDLAAFVCATGPPCARVVDGFVPRPIDGVHYSPKGAVWMLDWLLPRAVLAEEVARRGA